MGAAWHPPSGGIDPVPTPLGDLQGVHLAGAHARVLPCLTGDPEQELTLLRYHASGQRAISTNNGAAVCST